MRRYTADLYLVHGPEPGIQDICPVWLSELGCSLDSELTWFGKVCQYLASWQGEVGELRDESIAFFVHVPQEHHQGKQAFFGGVMKDSTLVTNPFMGPWSWS